MFHPAKDGHSRGAVLYVHPFAEETNKSRRMAALQCRAMAAAGYDLLQIDLQGCGDSGGDFGDATWQAWLEDLLEGYSCLRKLSQAPLILWGLRAGCLLASELAAKLPERVNFVFWQPVVAGKPHWQQFMRLGMASELASGQAKAIGEKLRTALASGKSIEIAGYTVSPALVEGLESAELAPPLGGQGTVLWFETSLRDEASIAPVSERFIDRWRGAGYVVQPQLVRAPAFWLTTEIEDAPELLDATLMALGELS
ncbi:MAG: esterase/lipase/thioesterase family active site [Proteobacteria bacterium]|nr:esterase/lipase/thioesterase family active site [Pseudomonadota bacterium]